MLHLVRFVVAIYTHYKIKRYWKQCSYDYKQSVHDCIVIEAGLVFVIITDNCTRTLLYSELIDSKPSQPRGGHEGRDEPAQDSEDYQEGLAIPQVYEREEDITEPV